MRLVKPLRPFLSIAFWLVLWACIVNGALLLISTRPPLAWLPQRVSGVGFVEDNRQRVRAAELEYAEHKVAATKYLGAIVGISTIREGVNLRILASETGPQWVFLGVAGAGGGIYSVKQNADVLLDSTLRPDLVVLGFTGAQILDTMLPWATPQQPLTVSIDSLYSTVRSLSWLTIRRQDIVLAIDQALLDLRVPVLKFLNVKTTSPDHRSPWREMMRLMGAEHYSESVLQRGIGAAEEKGIFDVDTYERSIEAPRMMAEVAGKFREAGAKVIVVLTPLHSWWRAREPADVHKYFQAALNKFAPGETIPVLDYRTSIDDDGFVDLVHLNTKGSGEFSRILAAEINRVTFTRAPLMSSGHPN